MRVIDNLQSWNKILNFRCLHQIAVPAHVAGDAAPLQRRLIYPGDHAGRAHQDHDIRRLRRAQRAVFRDGGLAQEPLNTRSDEFRLRARLVTAFFFRCEIIQAVQLDLRAGRVRELRAGDERFVLRVVQLPGLFFSSQAKTRRWLLPEFRRGNGNSATAAACAARRGLCAERRIGVVFGKEDRRIGQPEPVDRLLDVADHEQIFSVAADSLKNALLHGVGILVFVDQNLAVALRKAFRGLCRPAGALFVRSPIMQCSRSEKSSR